MTETEWLTSTDPAAMLYVVQGPSPEYGGFPTRKISDRKLRLCEDAVFERFGLNLEDLRDAATPPLGACALLRDILGNPFRPVTLTRTVLCDRCNGKGHRIPGIICGTCKGSGKTKGNGDWLTPQVVSLAQAAYLERERKCAKCDGKGNTWNYRGRHKANCSQCNKGTIDATLDPLRLAILADALEESGCTESLCPLCHARPMVRPDPAPPFDLMPAVCPRCAGSGTEGILTHLRAAGAHVRGCWVVDLLLGK